MKKDDYWYSVELIENRGVLTIVVRRMMKDCHWFDGRYYGRLFDSCDFYSELAWTSMCDFIRRCRVGCGYVLMKAYQIEKFLRDDCEVKL